MSNHSSPFSFNAIWLVITWALAIGCTESNSDSTAKPVNSDTTSGAALTDEPAKAGSESPLPNPNFAINIGSSDRSETSLDAANLQFSRGNLDGAIGVYRRLLRAEPDNADARLGLAMTLVRARQLPQATAHLDRLIRQNPEDWRPYAHRAHLKLEAKEWQSALEDFRAAIDRGQDTPENRAYIGLALLHLRRFEEANDEATMAITVDTDLAHAYFVRCIARSHLWNVEGASADLSEAKRCGLEERLIENCEELIRSVTPDSE